MSVRSVRLRRVIRARPKKLCRAFVEAETQATRVLTFAAHGQCQRVSLLLRASVEWLGAIGSVRLQ
jgi:hypothetical protein